MRRLNKGKLTKEDIEYIADEQEAWEEVAHLEQGYYEDGRRDTAICVKIWSPKLQL